jgi:hypothetical protein
MILLFAIGAPTLVILAYVLGGRKWLKKQPWSANFFTTIEPFEIVLWRKSETILWARFQQLLGIVLTLLSQLGTVDLSPLFPLLPPKLQWLPACLPLIVSIAGKIEEWNRLDTTKPLELVEVPDNAPLKVTEAVKLAEAVKVAAVAVVVAENTAEKKAEKVVTGGGDSPP